MQTRDYIELIITIVGGLIGCAWSFGYTYSKWQEGRSKQVIDSEDNELNTVNLYKQRVEALESKVGELMIMVNNLRQEVADKDNKLANALSILQGRNPQMETFITSMTQYIEDSKPFVENIKMRVIPVAIDLADHLDNMKKEVFPVIATLKKFLDQQVIK